MVSICQLTGNIFFNGDSKLLIICLLLLLVMLTYFADNTVVDLRAPNQKKILTEYKSIILSF